MMNFKKTLKEIDRLKTQVEELEEQVQTEIDKEQEESSYVPRRGRKLNHFKFLLEQAEECATSGRFSDLIVEWDAMFEEFRDGPIFRKISSGILSLHKQRCKQEKPGTSGHLWIRQLRIYLGEAVSGRCCCHSPCCCGYEPYHCCECGYMKHCQCLTCKKTCCR